MLRNMKWLLAMICFFYFLCTASAASVSLFRAKRSVDIPFHCLLPPDTGICYGYFLNYYYNPTKGECETFVYGGCQGNDNNFYSQADCEAVCKTENYTNPDANEDFELILESIEPLIENKDDCEYPPETGECRALFYHYYFNGVKCEEFVYGGCGGNPNNFRTEEDCMERCMPNAKSEDTNIDANEDFEVILESIEPLIENKDDCEYPPETGECRALFYHYYFNGVKCEDFVYGGCGGNPNNFRTEEACMERCMLMMKAKAYSENEV